jgi:hypothetical protein
MAPLPATTDRQLTGVGCPRTLPGRWDCQYLFVDGGDEGPVRRVELPELIGLTDRAAAQITTDRGIERVRVLQCVDGMTVTPMTMDWDLGRLNLGVEGGIVVNAVFG